MSKYTPGPWEYKKAIKPKGVDQEEDCLIYAKDERGATLHIAETFQYQNDDHGAANGTAEANARLIAAAPELLGICKELIGKQRTDCNDRNCGNCSVCNTKKAIAKAEE